MTLLAPLCFYRKVTKNYLFLTDTDFFLKNYLEKYYYNALNTKLSFSIIAWSLDFVLFRRFTFAMHLLHFTLSHIFTRRRGEYNCENHYTPF